MDKFVKSTLIFFIFAKMNLTRLLRKKNCPNFELARELLGFGEDIELIILRHLHVKIGQQVQNNWANYTKHDEEA
jgi:hypothetical protein